MSNALTPRAVIFDLDGVLVDSEGLHVDAWKLLFGREGTTVSDAEYEHGVGMTDIAWIRWLFERRGKAVDATWWQDAKRAVYGDILKANVRAFPGVPKLVERLWAEGFRLGVASSSWRENIETVVEGLGLADRFEAFVGKEDVARHKPAPDAYLRAARRLGVSPGSCTVLEDSVLGVRAAKAAGMRCIAVPNSLPADRLAEADLVLETLEDADRIIRFARGADAG
jgi:HAD superfamily hydrolase (TIGR01509 family)